MLRRVSALRDVVVSIGLRAIRGRAPRVDDALYAVWAAFWTLASARLFYGYLLKQTGGEWSAPLDDVFIHFDYARATAQGHPFEWTVGNGYSSGNTSLTYPFVLAFGWLVGFTGRDLMVFAAILAMTCVFGTLLAVRPIFVESVRDRAGRVGSYLLPPVFLGIGALDWSFWSGMEVAFFVATWAIALLAYLHLEAAARLPEPSEAATRRAWLLGAAGALLVTTRPEAAATLAVFGIAAAERHARRRGLRVAIPLLARAGVPGALALAAQTFANKALTGEWSANGAIVKLALNNPYMPPSEKLEDWIFNVKYAVIRCLDWHFAHVEGEHLAAWIPETWSRANPLVVLARHATFAGVVPLALGLLPLLFARTRRIAIVIWSQIVLWILVVALNGQVRWQNERYVMPAVAWLLVMVALGVVVALRKAAEAHGKGGLARPSPILAIVAGTIVAQTVGVLTRPEGAPTGIQLPWLFAIACGVAFWGVLYLRRVRGAVVLLALLFAYDHQIPKMRDQKWFFGRAARNIRDQHLALGKYLAELRPNRVLVGDAGAILYESDRPGLDIIGLGGYQKLPFARAGVHGLPATIELIERMPARDRPEVLAIFPTWWGVLPLWFGSDVLRRFPVEGNVICGGYEHVVYKADWHLLNSGDGLRFMPPSDASVRMELDVGDLVSERAASYAFTRPQNGWTDMRVLPDPTNAKLDLFDGGRRIAGGRSETFVLRGTDQTLPGHLVVRTAPEGKTRVRVLVAGEELGAFELDRGEEGAWVEPAVAIPAGKLVPGAKVELANEGPTDFVDYHLWVTQ